MEIHRSLALDLEKVKHDRIAGVEANDGAARPVEFETPPRVGCEMRSPSNPDVRKSDAEESESSKLWAKLNFALRISSTGALPTPILQFRSHPKLQFLATDGRKH